MTIEEWYKQNSALGKIVILNKAKYLVLGIEFSADTHSLTDWEDSATINDILILASGTC